MREEFEREEEEDAAIGREAGMEEKISRSLSDPTRWKGMNSHALRQSPSSDS